MVEVKRADFPYVQGSQSSEEEVVVRDRVLNRTERPSVREPGINGNHAPICQAWNNGSSDNSQ